MLMRGFVIAAGSGFKACRKGVHAHKRALSLNLDRLNTVRAAVRTVSDTGASECNACECAVHIYKLWLFDTF